MSYIVYDSGNIRLNLENKVPKSNLTFRLSYETYFTDLYVFRAELDIWKFVDFLGYSVFL